jgi:hypothetical protein
VTIAKVLTSPYFSIVRMTTAKDIVEKFELSNVGNSKPPQGNGKKGNSHLLWKIKFSAHLTMLGLKDCLTPEFVNELLAKEKDTFDLTSNKGTNCANAVRKNKKTMMQFSHSWTKNCSIKQAQSCNKSQYRLAIRKGT